MLVAHADAHVQPAVAIDDIVAAAAFDQVAAGSAENDVAAPNEVTPAPSTACRPEMRVMASVEHAALRACKPEFGGLGIVTAQDVARATIPTNLPRTQRGRAARRSMGSRVSPEIVDFHVDGDTSVSIL